MANEKPNKDEPMLCEISVLCEEVIEVMCDDEEEEEVIGEVEYKGYILGDEEMKVEVCVRYV